MNRLENDKYYTPIDLANYCWDKVLNTIGEDKISEIIEPSCGDGSFYHHSTHIPHFGYDIDPQCSFNNVITGDYLIQDITYMQGRLVIGNPPYGRCLNKAQKFFKKSVEIADYIAFILPISQLNNTNSMYEFDLIHSEDLGFRIYSDRELHCCFNIYARPQSGELNKKPQSKLKDITIYRQDSNNYDKKDYDIRMCYWGDGTAGKILKEDEHYSGEYKIKINNETLKHQIMDTISNFDWKDYIKGIAMRKIQQHHIIKILQDNIPEIK